MIKKLCVYAIIALLIAFIYLYILFTPPYASQIHFNSHKILITRDTYGIPHIHAPNRRSFLYAWGYAVAEDRLFQIAFRRLFAEGRLCEFLGSRALQSDIMMRDLSFSQVAQHIAQRIKTENETIHLDLSAFAQGINDQVSTRSLLPFQFYVLRLKWEPWSVTSILKLFKLLQFSISHNMIQEYARSALLANHSVFEINKLIPNTKQNWGFASQNTIQDEDIPEHLKSDKMNPSGLFEPLYIQKIIQLGMPEYFISAEGSNAWVVSGEHTQSGKPIVSGDPHLDNALPGHWYQFKATYTQNNKTTNFAGVAPPGIMITHGKSDYYAVGLAVLQTDTQDLYKQKIDGSKYLLEGEWRNLRVRNETILIRQGNKVSAYSHTVKVTHRGPILNYIVSPYGVFELAEPLSLAWTGYNAEYKSMMDVGCYFIQADNLNDMMPFLINGTSHFYSLNALFATRDNHIIYQQCGANPQRTNHTAGSYVKDGTSTKDDWLGFVSPHQRMHVLDPKKGFIVTSNNRVASHLYRGGYFDHMIYTARADRLTEVLQKQIAQGRKITNEFAVKLLYDTVDVYCRQILPQILTISPNASQKLRGFNCNFVPESYQATIYEVFMFQTWNLIKPVQHKNFSLLSFHVFQQCAYNAIHQAFHGEKSKKVAIDHAWQLAYVRLFQFFKTHDHTQWKWGLFHRDVSTQLPLGHHPLFSYFYRREFPGYGNHHTPNVAKCNKVDSGNFATSHRATLRTIFDYGGQSWWVVDGGVSQNILGKHYDDQWRLFVDEKLIPIDYSEWERNDEL